MDRNYVKIVTQEGCYEIPVSEQTSLQTSISQPSLELMTEPYDQLQTCSVLDTSESNIPFVTLSSEDAENNICFNNFSNLLSPSEYATEDCEGNSELQTAEVLEPSSSLTKEEEEKQYVKSENGEEYQCRTCLKFANATTCLVINEKFFFDKTAKEVIVFLVPEMDSKLMGNEVVCDDCLDVLRSTMQFIVKCLEVEAVLAKLKENENKTGVLENCKLEMEEPQFVEETVAVDMEHDYCVKDNAEAVENIQEGDAKMDYNNVPIVIETLDEYYEEDVEEPELIEAGEPSLTTKLITYRTLEPLNTKITEGKKTLSCSTCLQCFFTKDAFEDHLEIHPPHSCDVCGRAFRKRESLRAHKLTHNDPNSFICEVCGKGFKDFGALRVHLKGHADRSYACDKCSKVFKTRRVLDIHVKYVHDKVYESQCTVCGILCRNGSSLQNHMRLVHVKEKPFECNICQKRFGRSDYLHNHKLRHAGEGRPSNKSQVEVRNSRRRMRMRYKTQSSGEPLPCKFCGQWYKGVVRLKRHLEAHLKRYPCQFCPLTFPRNSLCKRHEETHLGGTVTFVRCNVCWKKFKTKEALDKHVALHNNPQHFCDLCGKTFNRKFLLSQHKVMEHSDIPDMKQIDTIIYDSLLEVGVLST